MFRNLLVGVLILGMVGTLFAQKTQKSSGEYQLSLTNSNFSEQAACQYCLERAMVDAIEKAFGSVVIQGNTTSVRNENTGETVETTQIFNMIAETYVNGQWLKTLDEECERFTSDNGEFWISCKVKGTVQELEKPSIDLKIKALDCESAGCETSQFKDGESFYLYLKSPVDGYVTVYLSDAYTAQRLFPYRNMPSDQMNSVPVKADKEYILFSGAKDQFGLKSYVDEYELFANEEVDQNRIFVVFTQEPITKPALSKGGKNESVEMPMELKSDDFHEWLAKNKQYNKDMEVARLDIMIRKE
ncbi:MAG: hypothetical protein SF052_13195 [Bacteroidia bacterium]|nr:hypothetical protein [Bacteroidia bacterium]